MNILFIGDIFASGGRGIVADRLNDLITEHKVHLAIANAENSAGGFGITPAIAEDLLSLGMDRGCCGRRTIRIRFPVRACLRERLATAFTTPC
jgi:calcineurin-like phosphoesterase